jgi:hypothetical protein
VYGQEGVGKSSFGAASPCPIFLDVEQGTLNLDTTRFEFEAGRTAPGNYEELLGALRILETQDHPYKTLVVDTLDAVEGVIWAHVCARDGKSNIAEYGFGKGENIVALNEWRRLIAALERVRAKGMNVLTLSHSVIKRFDDPEGEGYDRHILKLHEKAGGLVKERADAVLFAKFEIVRTKDTRGGMPKVRAALTDSRFLYTRKTAAYDAKNRHDLPPEIPLNWDDLWTAILEHRPANPVELTAAIRAAAKRLGGETEKMIMACLAEAGKDAVKLSKINSRCNARLAEAGQERNE